MSANFSGGPDRVDIPDGRFPFGSSWNESHRYPGEFIQRLMPLDEPFAIATTPMTVTQYREFLKANSAVEKYKSDRDGQVGCAGEYGSLPAHGKDWHGDRVVVITLTPAGD